MPCGSDMEAKNVRGRRKPVKRLKIVVDVLMTVSLLLLMAYGLIGEKAHEWIGIGMLALFILHHVLNRKWIGAIGKGRYTAVRILQTVTAGLILLCMLGSMVSGIILSRYVFAAIPMHRSYALAERLHMLCAYWGFLLMSLHLGFHWSVMLSTMKMRLRSSKMTERVLSLLGYLFAAYGVYAFFHRNLGDYLLLRSHFVFFDYGEPVWRFLVDYAAIMAAVVTAGCWVMKGVHRKKKII